MNKMEKALWEMSQMDELSSQDSFVHSLHPACKLILTLSYIALIASCKSLEAGRLLALSLCPLAGYALAGISPLTCFYKLRLVLPLVMAVGLFNPFYDRVPLFYLGRVPVTRGMVSMVTLMGKGVLCLTMSFLLIATTRIEELCASLRGLGLPSHLVSLFLLTYRYVGLFTEELSIMEQAYHLRAPGQKGIHVSAWGSFLGQALLRTMDRAEQLYESMLLRGYDGSFPSTFTRPFQKRDALILLLSLAFLLFLRFFDLTKVLGELVLSLTGAI